MKLPPFWVSPFWLFIVASFLLLFFPETCVCAPLYFGSRYKCPTFLSPRDGYDAFPFFLFSLLSRDFIRCHSFFFFLLLFRKQEEASPSLSLLSARRRVTRLFLFSLLARCVPPFFFFSFCSFRLVWNLRRKPHLPFFSFPLHGSLHVIALLFFLSFGDTPDSRLLYTPGDEGLKNSFFTENEEFSL